MGSISIAPLKRRRAAVEPFEERTVNPELRSFKASSEGVESLRERNRVPFEGGQRFAEVAGLILIILLQRIDSCYI